MRTEPRGYWTRVFDQAATLLRARPDLNGDTAYWLARRMVDLTTAEDQRERAVYQAAETVSPVLVLAP